jgi:hypothetical protein
VLAHSRVDLLEIECDFGRALIRQVAIIFEGLVLATRTMLSELRSVADDIDPVVLAELEL